MHDSDRRKEEEDVVIIQGRRNAVSDDDAWNLEGKNGVSDDCLIMMEHEEDAMSVG